MFSGLGKEGDPPGGRDSSLECTSPLLSRYHRVAYRPARGPVPPHYSTVQTARVKRRLQGQFDTPQSVGSMPHAGPPSGIATPLTTRVPKIFAAEAEFLRWRLLCVSRRTSQKQEREERRQRYIRAARFWIRTTLRRSWAAWKSHLRLALCIKRIRHRSAHAAWNAWVGLVTYKRDTQAKLAGAVAKMANRGPCSAGSTPYPARPPCATSSAGPWRSWHRGRSRPPGTSGPPWWTTSRASGRSWRARWRR